MSQAGVEIKLLDAKVVSRGDDSALRAALYIMLSTLFRAVGIWTRGVFAGANTRIYLSASDMLYDASSLPSLSLRSDLISSALLSLPRFRIVL